MLLTLCYVFPLPCLVFCWDGELSRLVGGWCQSNVSLVAGTSMHRKVVESDGCKDKVEFPILIRIKSLQLAKTVLSLPAFCHPSSK